MSRISRLAVLVTALTSLVALLYSTAGAVTFTNSGSTAFTAAGSASTLGITPTAGGGGTPSNLSCATSSATGTIASGAFTSASGTITFTGCKLVGLETHYDCNFTLTPQTTDNGITQGILDLHCLDHLQTTPFTPLCAITGTTPVTYHNPIGTTKARLTLQASGSLTVHNASGSLCSSAGVPAGASRFGDLSAHTINITNGTPTTLGPIITSP